MIVDDHRPNQVQVRSHNLQAGRNQKEIGFTWRMAVSQAVMCYAPTLELTPKTQATLCSMQKMVILRLLVNASMLVLYHVHASLPLNDVVASFPNFMSILHRAV